MAPNTVSSWDNGQMSNPDYSVAVIIPVLNEGKRIETLLHHMQPWRSRVIIVDGGSTDETRNICKAQGFRIIQSDRGRARQMNAGADEVVADCYWFLHADCIPPTQAVDLIQQSLKQGFAWGRFDVRLSGKNPIYRVIGKMMNWRSCLTRVATGDQGIFVLRSLFEEIGGYPSIPLMEDIAISKALRKRGRDACIHENMQVSSRRWQEKGVIRTMLLMWWLRWRYFLGADPAVLHRAYYGR